MHQPRQTLTLLTAGEQPLELEDVKNHLRVDTEDEDELITEQMDTAKNYVDGRDGVLGRALLTQQWRMTRESFTGHHLWAHMQYPNHYLDPRRLEHHREILIPLPPLQTIDEITYYDTSGAVQTLDPSTYRIVQGGGFKSSIIPTTNNWWPATQCVPDAVTIDFTAGYEDVDALSAERKSILQAMLLLIDNWFQNREAALIGARAASVNTPFGVDALLERHRVSWF